MKKYIVVFLLIFVGAFIYLLSTSTPNDNFVSIHNKKFQLNGNNFHPITLNYIVSTQANKDEIWACPYFGYNSNNKHRFTTKDSSLIAFKADMELIREMGFNTIRLVAVGEESIEDKKTGDLSISANINNQRDTTIMLTTDENYDKYFNELQEMFNIINHAGLKVILLVRTFPEIHTTEEHVRKLATHFRNESTIMAYDFFNEPLYFDSLVRDKKDVYPITKNWQKIIKTYAPNQLSTIGLSGIREVFEWDPNFMEVDFISFHPYEYEPDMVRGEIFWYSKYVKKPWMIGETSIPADNDSVSYREQNKFARKTLKQTFNCGGIGYSWWQYKDVEWYDFHANFMGVMNPRGETTTKNKKNIPINGTVKSIVEEFKNYVPSFEKDSCICTSNYYNYYKFTDSKITGYLMDAENNPIEGGIILAWNQWWNKSYTTITKADGSFEVLGNFPFYHWMASATEYSMVRGDISPDSAKTYADNIPTINLGTLQLDKVDLDD